MATKLLQPSLSAGELAPGLHGRVDTARYAVGLKTCRNFVTRVTGGAVKRPGFRFCGEVKDSTKYTRILPFVYSTSVKYLIEAGDNYFRFWVNGARLEVAGVPVEVATPYTSAELPQVRITQSADVLYLVHPSHQPRELRRLTSTSFELRLFDFRRGPFRLLNGAEAVMMAVSGTTGNVTVTCNSNVFTASMIGGLIYLEEKELRTVKPWEPLERNVTVGTLRRSDGKVYRATAVTIPSGAGTPFNITGNTRPLHEVGRAWDGPGDQRNDGVNDYSVGVEWEYVHGGFGIVKITGYTSGSSVTGVVIQRIPDSIVGTAPSPGATWTFSGDGVTKVFSLTSPNNTSPTQYDYTVTIGGSVVSPNPYHEPTTGGGGVGGGNDTGPRQGDTPIYDIPAL